MMATVMAELPLPVVGDTPSQLLPPLEVEVETTKLPVGALDGKVSCSVCEAGLVAPGAEKLNCDCEIEAVGEVAMLSVTGI